MYDERTLSRLESTAANEPESIDVRALCTVLGSDDAATRNRAHEIRDCLLENTTDPSPAIDALLDCLDDHDDDCRLAAVETLTRFGRVWPRTVASAVATELESPDVRRRAAAADVLGRTRDGAALPYVPGLVTALEDPDDRVGALAVKALSGLADWFPAAVTSAVPRVQRFLDEKWLPTDDGGLRLIYTRDDHEPDDGGGEPDNVRLTNHVPRPYERTRSLLETLSLTHPAALEPVLPRLRELVRSPPEGARVGLSSLILTLTRVARADPATIDGVRPALERYAASDRRHVRVAARNLLTELGVVIDHPEPVSLPSQMAVYDRPKQDGDDDFLSGIDQRAILGELDFDTVVALLHCEEDDVRDTAAWGLECGVDGYIDRIHDRASTFLSLLSEPDDCTRTHLLRILGFVVRAYPEEWTPALLVLTDHDDPRVRSAATTLLASAAGVYPALVRPHVETVAAQLSDPATGREGALSVLRSLAEPMPDATTPHVSAAVDALADREPRITALRFLESLARVRPAAVATHADSLESLVAVLAGPSAIDDRARVDRTGHAEIEDVDRALEVAFRVCLRLASDRPDAVAAIRPHAERVVDGRYYGERPARAFLTVLDGGR